MRAATNKKAATVNTAKALHKTASEKLLEDKKR
jgi:hypothetical protein